MDKNEACQIIENIRDSLINYPSQFNFKINIFGQQISASESSIGAVISAQGGAPGSLTVGNQITLDGAKVEILKDKGNQVKNDQFNAVIESLNEIINQLKSGKTDKNIIKAILERMKNSWVPDLIITILTTILLKSIGL